MIVAIAAWNESEQMAAVLEEEMLILEEEMKSTTPELGPVITTPSPDETAPAATTTEPAPFGVPQAGDVAAEAETPALAAPAAERAPDVQMTRGDQPPPPPKPAPVENKPPRAEIQLDN